nr:MBL fold metallo-hydrolase [Pseudenhygromyxa sp. WMMC2535]
MPRKLTKFVKFAGMGLGALVLAFLCLWLSAWDAYGAAAEGERLERMHNSPQWTGEGFGNRLPRVDGSPMAMLRKSLFAGSSVASPDQPIAAVQTRHGEEFVAPPDSGLRVTWLGHSTLLVEIDGARVLVDPVFGPRASPFSWLGPARFYAPPLPLDELPAIDAVLISHDHYDHLDYPTVRALADREITWMVPLGIGAHLEAWGVPPARVVELDWWEDHEHAGLRFTCTPARHFSGRSLFMADQDATLWSGWAVRGPEHAVFYSGDTALHDEFVDIGARLGPFDLTMIESGAYDGLWSDVHLGPEQAVIAHQLVGGAVMLPVHWGAFDLALHGWTEPIERVLVAADEAGVQVVSPAPGGSVEPSTPGELVRWWPALPWQGVEEAPAWSTSVEHLQAGMR